MKRVLFYCQHLLGVGHLIRSLAICAELKKVFDVDFVQGGPDIGISHSEQNLRIHFLHPFLMEEDTEEFYDPSGKLDNSEIWQKRSQQIQNLNLNKVDAIVIELFPFGRNKFKQEILNLIKTYRQQNTLVYCSLRDIVMPVADTEKRNRKNAQILNEYFDKVLVHSDERFIPLGKSYTGSELIHKDILYTGFVSRALRFKKEKGESSAKKNTSQPPIVVSAGGSKVGEELLSSVFRTALHLKKFQWKIFCPAKTLLKLKEYAETNDNNGNWSFHLGSESAGFHLKFLDTEFDSPEAHSAKITLAPFSQDFINDLSTCQLSISMAGYNTVAEVLGIGCPALFYPHSENIEQSLRAESLASKCNHLDLLTQNDLQPKAIANKILSLLQTENHFHGSNLRPNLEGAKNTCRILQEDLQ